jgi:5'-nucleotidase
VLTEMDLTIDGRTRRITSITANNGIVTRTTPAADITAILDWYRPYYGALAGRVIGQLEPGVTSITRSTNAAGESPLGNLIADSQLAATAPSGFGDAQVAFMNPGGIRDNLVALPDGSITYEAAFTVQPFGNSLVTMTLTGAQIERLLEQQFCGTISNRILQISEGFTYTYDASQRNQPCATADAVPFDSILLAGQPLVAGQTYRVTVNNFLAGGGDSFPVLTEGTNLLGGALDLDALEAHLLSFGGGVPTPPLGRITRLN